jgi:hypothetical protein
MFEKQVQIMRGESEDDCSNYQQVEGMENLVDDLGEGVEEIQDVASAVSLF